VAIHGSNIFVVFVQPGMENMPWRFFDNIIAVNDIFTEKEKNRGYCKEYIFQPLFDEDKEQFKMAG
jgi:hypothetical protein